MRLEGQVYSSPSKTQTWLYPGPSPQWVGGLVITHCPSRALASVACHPHDLLEDLSRNKQHLGQLCSCLPVGYHLSHHHFIIFIILIKFCQCRSTSKLHILPRPHVIQLGFGKMVTCWPLARHTLAASVTLPWVFAVYRLGLLAFTEFHSFSFHISRQWLWIAFEMFGLRDPSFYGIVDIVIVNLVHFCFPDPNHNL